MAAGRHRQGLAHHSHQSEQTKLCINQSRPEDTVRKVLGTGLSTLCHPAAHAPRRAHTRKVVLARLCDDMITSLAARVWRRGPHASHGLLHGARDGGDAGQQHAQHKQRRRHRAHTSPACTLVTCLVAAAAVLALGWWWVGNASRPTSSRTAVPSHDGGPAPGVLRGATDHTPAGQPAHKYGAQGRHVPRSLRHGAPPFQAEWAGLPDYAATGLELPALATRVVSAWGSPEAIAHAAAAARDAAAAAGGRGAGAGGDVPPEAHAEADADVTVVVSPKDLFNVTRQVR